MIMSKNFKNIIVGLFYSLIFLLVISCSNNSPENKEKENSIEGKKKDMEIEQAVIVNFNYGIQGLDSLFKLEDKLEKIFEQHPQLGDYDGNEIAIDYSDGTFFFYGPGAQKIFDAIKPVLQQTNFMKGADVTLRFGPPEEGVKEIIVDL